MMKLWQGKRILVTGGAVRIGKGFVESFQAAGAEVVVHYQHSKAEAEELSAYTVKADLSDLSVWSGFYLKQVLLMFSLIMHRLLPRIDSHQSTPERVENELRVNLMAPLELVRQFAQQVDQGVVLNLLDRRIVAHDPSCLAYALKKKSSL